MPDQAPAGNQHPARVGLAMAGGGPGGAIYEIGALRALDEAIEGLDLNGLDIYVGVSAGAFVGASLANGLTPRQMVRAIVSRDPGEHPFVPETFLTPSLTEIAKRLASVPALVASTVMSILGRSDDSIVGAALKHAGQALPVGLFDNEPLRVYLERIYNLKGRTDDFRQLSRKLVVVAADLDAGKAVRFGTPGWDHVPISKAVQASTALPGLYPPVEIDGRLYVDGVLLRTLHASAALEQGVELLLCLNPIVPVDTAQAVEEGFLRTGQLAERGLPAVLAQAVRTLIHSRLEVGMAAYKPKYSADIVMLEPKRDDYRMFFTNIFGFRDRQAVCEHAYEQTRRELLLRFDELGPKLAKHGLTLRRDVLEDETRDLWVGVGLPHLSTRKSAQAGLEVVTDLDRALRRLERMLEPEEPLVEPAPLPAT
jgi:NTE family protein